MATDIQNIFAQNGDTTTVPEGVQIDGSVNYDQGYTNNYQLDPSSDPNALRIERNKMNYLFNVIYGNLKELLEQGFNNHIVSREYSIGDIVRATDGFDYISIANSNTQTPPDTNWQLAYLRTNNTGTFTPAADYEPATKKYVDDNAGGGGGVRQTVQYSSVDANGQPNYISIGTGLAVDIAATTTPIKISSSNGAVENDRTGTISTDTTISGLTDATTNYLYADVAGDGSVTLGATTLSPVYQFGGTYSVTSGQATFNISEMKMKVGNGATADQTYRVFIGEAITSGGVVTAVVNYALNGEYESTFTATFPTGYVLISKNSNLGVYARDIYCVLENTTANIGYSIGDQVILSSPSGSSSDNNPTLTASKNTVSMATYNGGSPILLLNKSTGAATPITASSWKYKLIAKRGW